jgi:hypothetical protein
MTEATFFSEVVLPFATLSFDEAACNFVFVEGMPGDGKTGGSSGGDNFVDIAGESWGLR